MVKLPKDCAGPGEAAFHSMVLRASMAQGQAVVSEGAGPARIRVGDLAAGRQPSPPVSPAAP